MLNRDVWLPINASERLYAHYFGPENPKTVAIAIHGSIENGRIFYPKNGSRLAEYLAKHNIGSYVWDLRGRGKSTPPISRDSDFNQTDLIVHDLPSIATWVHGQHPEADLFWLSHSWGGVLIHATLLRFPSLLKISNGLVHFGTKRSVRVHNPKRWFMLDLVWNRLAFLWVKKYGYLPARTLRMGSDNESEGTHRDTVHWVKATEWIDPRDGFDYAAAAHNISLPPCLFLSAQRDSVLGHQSDVRRFAKESNPKIADFIHLSRKNGFRHNYDHITMLTHPDAKTDVFPKVLNWISGVKERRT